MRVVMYRPYPVIILTVEMDLSKDLSSTKEFIKIRNTNITIGAVTCRHLV